MFIQFTLNEINSDNKAYIYLQIFLTCLNKSSSKVFDPEWVRASIRTPNFFMWSLFSLSPSMTA